MLKLGIREVLEKGPFIKRVYPALCTWQHRLVRIFSMLSSMTKFSVEPVYLDLDFSSFLYLLSNTSTSYYHKAITE